MKLIRCHVDSFGKLSDFDLEFNEGLTVLCEANGFGKSTLASFLKAMFYGLGRTGAPERKKYLPWQGGRFGGSLDVEIDGISYRITRYFAQSAPRDTFALYDLTNHTDSVKYTANIGAELFALDGDSFARSIYQPQLSEGWRVTNDIRTKLSNLVDNTNDMNNYETAQARLTDRRRKLQAFRGNGGEISKLREKQLSAEQEIDLLESQRATLATLAQALEAAAQEKAVCAEAHETLRSRLQQAATQEAQQLRRDQYTALEQTVRTYKSTVHSIEANYPKGLPTAADLCAQRDALRAKAMAEQQLANRTLSAEETRIITEGSTLFTNAAQDFSLCQGWITEQAAGKQALSTLGTAPETPPIKKSPLPTLCAALGAGLLVAGVLCFVLSQLALGAVLAVLGFCGVLAALWLRTAPNSASNVQEQLRIQRLSELESQQNALTEKIEELLKRYQTPICADYQTCLDNLRRQEEQYREVRLRAQSLKPIQAEANAQIENANRTIDRFYEQFGIDEDADLTKIETDTTELLHAKRSLEEAERQLAAFGEVPPCPDTQLPSVQALQEQEKSLIQRQEMLSNQLQQIRQQHLELSDRLQTLPTLRDRCAALTEQCEETEHKRDLLDAAAELLAKAKDHLSTSYIGKVEEGFRTYVSALLSSRLGQVFVDKDMNILIEEQGQQRNLEAFSTGTADSVNLAMRLALVDALFTQEQPFLILDDPFVNLDDDHTKEALSMLSKLSEERQILYLVCHTGRVGR